MVTYNNLAFALDFGYEWYWIYGHAVPLAIFGALLALAITRGWARWLKITLGIVTAWSLTAFVIMRLVLNFNAPMSLPTGRFLSSGTGRVIDLGCGSGRGTLMVAQVRPQTKLVAFDRFAAGYGIEGNTPARLKANLEAAGLGARVEIQSGDMRELPFPDNSFQGAVSTYAMDHLRRADFRKAVAETARVLEPGGQFLFLTIDRDLYVKIAFPLLHGGYFGPSTALPRWQGLLEESGRLEVVEHGNTPGTLWILCRRKQAQ